MTQRNPKIRKRNIELVSKTAKALIKENGYTTSRIVCEKLKNIKILSSSFTIRQVGQYIKMSGEFNNERTKLTMKMVE